MKTLHAKSPCCREKIYKFGNRRRQCQICKKTWRIRKKRRGRKRLRVHPSLELTVLERKESLRHRAQRLNRGRELLRRRHERNLELLLKHLPKPSAPPGFLIAICDGLGIRLEKQRFTLYLILLRSLGGQYAIPMEPVLLPGWEYVDGWRYVFKTLPLSAQKRIRAVVSDGIAGVESFAKERDWVAQRCHFHLLAQLQSLRGKRWSTASHKALRERIYQNVRRILETPDNKEAEVLVQQTQAFLRRPDCPKWIRSRISGFTRKSPAFRAYREYSHLNLPTTTNTAECVFNTITQTIRLTRGFSSSQSFEKWIKVQIRNMKPIQCNGGNYQPK